MAENEGLHLQLTADASSYISTINRAKKYFIVPILKNSFSINELCDII